ncbi:sickle tail protein homolog isoform X2 [Oncorhynchus kisutch]|uniref:sickle tail protein homolog isoform X2 n=1 Tax=Oncorhynchus kisutch TaxID=8019 RepID=UPI0012DCA270|nr:sickle tail protein homolog isoform X2 [Oncorhynchus kisutch]
MEYQYIRHTHWRGRRELGNNNQRVSSPEDVERFHRQQTVENQNHHSEPRSPSTVPRRYTIGGQGPRSARDPLTMQHADVERKKEVFLEHLKQRYPHHAAVIMGHQDRLRDHARSPQHSASPPPSIGEQLEHLSLESLETMSEGDGPAVFTRGCQARASLPVVRSANQTRDRSLGVLYLQYAEETKQIRMPNEITSIDTIRALFVSAFPQQLTIKMLESPSVAVYIKDETRNMYHELTDVRNITSRCCLKVYHKDPAHAFNRSNARPNNAEGRIPREILYGSHSPVHTLQSTCSPVHSIQGSMSPPTVRSMPSSPARIPYGHRSGGGVPGSATLPRASMSSGPPSRSVTPSPSAILERRDVKPDEDLSSTSMALVRADGLYVNVIDPYAVQEGRLSIASSQGGGHMGDMVDIGGGSLHRALVKSPASYTENPEQQHSLYRQKSRRYGESQGLPPLGTKTPPPSPHRLNDNHGPVASERGSPIRRSLRKESNGNTVEVVNRTRGSVSSVSSSPVFVELPSGHYGDRLFQGHFTPNDPQTSERMKAMEQQIASLAGLVQHALAIGPAEIDRRTASPFHVNNSAGVSPVPASRTPALLADGFNALVPQAPSPDSTLQVTLTTVRRNVTDLRQQLHQLRQLQMQNQDSVKGMLKRAEEELAEVMSETLQRQQQETEPGQRQRTTVDGERRKYQAMEERVLAQLRELEEYVDRLRRDSSSGKGQLSITLRDVEEGAVNLRRVGEALAGLKGEFPSLHGKMRTVLRVEVEAVRFLKEEPHKMDSMLKRVKALTEALSGLRRCVTENHPHNPEPGAATAEGGIEPAIAQSEPPRKNLPTMESPKPQPRPSVRPPQPQVKNPAGRPDTVPTSPDIVHRVKSSPVNMHSCQHSAALPHHPSPPLTSTHGRDSPTVAKVSPRSRENSPALQKRIVPWCGDGPAPTASSTETTSQPPGSEEIHTNRGSIKHIVMDVETAEREHDLEEGRSPQNSAATYSGSEFEQILQEAQASLMKAIPDLEVTETGRREAQSSPPPLAPDQPSLPDPELPLNPPLPDEVDAPQPTEASLPEPTQAADVAAEVTVQVSPERPHKSMVEKPRRPSVEREMKNSPEKSGKSLPPPPPRRLFPSLSGPGLTTGRSGEVIFTTRKEATTAQDDEEAVVPQPSPKPTRQPPEVKPKPQTTPVFIASAEPGEKEDEEEEDDDEEEDKFMKELQVFQKYTLRDVSTKCVIDLTSTASQVRQIEPELSLSPKDPKESQENKGKEKSVLNTDENRFVIVPKSPRVMYYVTGQLSNEKPPSGKTDQSEGREGTLSPSQVANSNTFDSQQTELLIADTTPLVSCNSVLESQDCPPNIQKIAVGEDSGKESVVDENVQKDPVQCQKVGVVEPVSPPVPAEKQDISEPSQQDCYLTNSKPSSSSSSSPPPSSPASPPLPLSSSLPPPVPVIQFVSSTGQEVSGSPGSPPESRGLDDSQSQQVVLRSFRSRAPRYVEEGSSLSPDLPDEEGPPPPENISFMMITSNRVQALSTGEYQEIVNGTSMSEVQTVSVGNDTTSISQEHSGFDRKPVIIIFDEPMDIRSAYKRMSTIFECEEELDRLLHQESIKEEAEEAGSEKSVPQVKSNTYLHQANKTAVTGNTATSHHNTPAVVAQQKSTAECSLPEQSKTEPSNTSKPETKKKFKFKFPKNKLAAISQAIRTGTKTGKKTLQVVVYEDEEEWDGHMNETERFEINSSSIPQTDFSHLTSVNNITSPSTLTRSNSKRRTEEICKNAYDSITSLEETIKQLEITVDNISPAAPNTDSCEASPATVKSQRERSPSKRPAPPQVSKFLKHPQSKTSKPELPRPSITSSSKKQNTSGSPSSSQMSLSVSAKSWQQPAGSADKPGGKTQKQFPQANRSAEKAGGDSNHYFLALPASKIPAFCHNSGKNMSLPGPNTVSNPIKSPSSSPSSSHKSVIPSLNLSRLVPPSPSLNDRRQNLSLSSQTQNGRPSPFSHCSSSSSSSTSPSSNSSSLSPTSTSSTSSSPPSPSLLSPTAMSQGARSIHRIAHIPSFTGQKMQGGYSSKTTHTPAASLSKDI